jgi:hypothetical protein
MYKQGEQTLFLPLNDLQPGIYVLNITAGEASVSRKLTIIE